MRIAIIGPQGSGKSTLVKDICATWPRYKTPARTYRDLIEEKGLKINRVGNLDAQKQIRDFLVDQVHDVSNEKYVVLDRTVLDNFVYSMWLFQQESTDIPEEFMQSSAVIAKMCLQHIDIIFYCSMVELDEEAKKDPTRDSNERYRQEIDAIYRVFLHDAFDRAGVFFKQEDECPPIIEIAGTPEQRLAMVKLYVNESGDPYENTSFITEEDLKAFKEQVATSPSIIAP